MFIFKIITILLFINAGQAYENDINKKNFSIEKNTRLNNIFDEIALNLKIPEQNLRLVRRHEKWYLKNQENYKKMLKRSEKYIYYVVKQLNKRNMPLDLALLPMVESAYNPIAYSRAHAAGMWQFIPDTGKKYDLKRNWWVDERRNVVKSTDAALNYLTDLHNEFNDWELSLAAYNCGENRIRREIKRNKRRGKPPKYKYMRLPRETRNYLPKLQALKNLIFNHQMYNLEKPFIENKPYFEVFNLDNFIETSKILMYSGISEQEFKTINPSYKRPVIVGNNNKIILPLKYKDNFISNYKNNDGKLSWKLYKIKSEDNLKKLAKKFDMKYDELRKANGIKRYVSPMPGIYILVKKVDTSSKSNIYKLWNKKEFKNPYIDSSRKMRYVVKKGDSLYLIANRFNTSVNAIKSWNNIRGTIIYKGQKLIIYTSGFTYKVRRGDSLSTIARQFKTSIRSLKKWNKIRGTLIRENQILIIYK